MDLRRCETKYTNYRNNSRLRRSRRSLKCALVCPTKTKPTLVKQSLGSVGRKAATVAVTAVPAQCNMKHTELQPQQHSNSFPLQPYMPQGFTPLCLMKWTLLLSLSKRCRKYGVAQTPKVILRQRSTGLGREVVRIFLV